MKYFGTVRQNLWRKIVTIPAPLVHKFFPYQNFSETQNGSLAKFFRSCEIKKFRQNRESSPLLCLNFFDTRILSNYRRVHLRMLSALWGKNFSTEFSDIPCAKNLPIHEIFWNTEVLPNENFSVLCRTQIFRRRNMIPPPLWCIKYFDTRNFLIHRSVLQRNFSVPCDKKFWTRIRDTPSFA